MSEKGYSRTWTVRGGSYRVDMRLPHPDEFMELTSAQRAMAALRTLDPDGGPNTGRDSILGGEVSSHWPGSGLSHLVLGHPGSPKVDPRKFEQAVSEAFDRLVREGLVALDASQRGSNNWVVVTEEGREALEDEASAPMARETKQLLGLLSLHERIDKRVRRALDHGDLQQAVSVAFVAVEAHVRDAAVACDASLAKALPSGLMSAAFKVGGVLADRSDDGEQIGVMQLFQGAMGAYRNPNAHGRVEYNDVAEVIRLVLFADQLLRMVDDVPVPTP